MPDCARGSLSRWLTEPAPGLYVGSLAARVRDELWKQVSEAVGDGAAVCIHPADNEQRYTITTAGDQRRQVLDFDGLHLIGFATQDEPIPQNEQLPFSNTRSRRVLSTHVEVIRRDPVLRGRHAGALHARGGDP